MKSKISVFGLCVLALWTRSGFTPTEAQLQTSDNFYVDLLGSNRESARFILYGIQATTGYKEIL